MRYFVDGELLERDDAIKYISENEPLSADIISDLESMEEGDIREIRGCYVEAKEKVKLTKRELKEIRAMLNEDGYMSYDDKTEYLMEEFGLTRHEAEGIVWDSTLPEWML